MIASILLEHKLVYVKYFVCTVAIGARAGTNTERGVQKVDVSVSVRAIKSLTVVWSGRCGDALVRCSR